MIALWTLYEWNSLCTSRVNIYNVIFIDCIVVVYLKTLRNWNVASSKLWRDNGDKSAEWGPHLWPVDHLIVRSPIKIQIRQEWFSRFFEFANVAILAEEQGWRLEKGGSRGPRLGDLGNSLSWRDTLRKRSRREQALSCWLSAVDVAMWSSHYRWCEREGPGVEWRYECGAQRRSAGGANFGCWRVGQAEIPRLQGVEMMGYGEGEAWWWAWANLGRWSDCGWVKSKGRCSRIGWKVVEVKWFFKI